MRLTSSAFNDGQLIPSKYTCDGQGVSPPLTWDGVPERTKSLALIVDDPDAPSGLFVHWLLYGIPSSENGLQEGAVIPKAGDAREGKNGFGKTGYGGPCPPKGAHRYLFHLYALDDNLAHLGSGAGRQDLDKSMQGHILAETQLTGRYERERQQ